MNLLEVDGKEMLAANGVKVPRGALWPSWPDCTGPWVVKAQIPDGKRGKQGGIMFANEADTLPAMADGLLGQSLGGHRIGSVYVEERLDIVHELYLSVSIDRDLQRHVIIVSPHGGMDIESVADDDILKLPIDPLLGWHHFHGSLITRFCNVPMRVSEQFHSTVEAVYHMAVSEDAELVEINPLAITCGGDVVACDAKVVLDDNASFRHLNREWQAESTIDSPLEAEIAAAGAVGIEIDPHGDVIAVVSGAGLMMATLDLLSDAGLTVRCVVDLGGTVLSGGEGLQRVLAAIAPTHPKVTFVNAFMQTALCDVFADGLATAYMTTGLSGRVIVRLNGRHADVGRNRLQSIGFDVHENLSPAIASTASLSREDIA